MEPGQAARGHERHIAGFAPTLHRTLSLPNFAISRLVPILYPGVFKFPFGAQSMQTQGRVIQPYNTNNRYSARQVRAGRLGILHSRLVPRKNIERMECPKKIQKISVKDTSIFIVQCYVRNKSAAADVFEPSRCVCCTAA